MFMVSLTAFASTTNIKHVGGVGEIPLTQISAVNREEDNKTSETPSPRGDGAHNCVYAREIFVYAGFQDSEGNIEYYTYNGYSKSFSGNNEFGTITIDSATKNALDAFGAANNLTLVQWLVRPKFEVYSDNPISITYNFYGVSNKTESINEGIYEISYIVPVGETNGRFSGYLTFRATGGKITTSQFVQGAILPSV